MSRDSFDDFLRVKKFPDLLTKILRGFFWQFYVDFCILSPSACNVDLQGIPIYTTSNVDVHVVSLSIACSVDMEGGLSPPVYNCRVYHQYTIAGCISSIEVQCVSLSSACGVVVQDVSLSTVSIVSRVSHSLF